MLCEELPKPTEPEVTPTNPGGALRKQPVAFFSERTRMRISSPPAPSEPTPPTTYEPISEKADIMFYYHSDHLGSSSYVTDSNGRPIAYYDYLPFGEVMVEHNQTTNFNNGYKFNAKELDEATGMYYYGARYYDPRLSIFISVDPLTALAPNWTPYRYAFNNPIMFRDLTGLFETRKDAKEYRKANNIEGRIKKNGEGNYSIYGKYTEYTRGDDSDPTLSDSRFNDGVVESLLIEKNSSAIGIKDIYDTVGTELSFFENITYNSMSTAQKSKFVWDSRKLIEKTVGKKIPLSNSTLYRNTIPKTLKGVGIGMGTISGGITLYDVYDKQEIRASHVLDATITVVSFIPGGGWIVGGVYFIGDLGVKATTGQSIADHLDEFVEEKYNKDNGVLVDFK